MSWRRAVSSALSPPRVGLFRLLVGGIGWAVFAVGTFIAIRAMHWDPLIRLAGALGVGPVTPGTVIVFQLTVAALAGLAAVTVAPTVWRRLERHT